VGGYTQILVHIPSNGADTAQAAYNLRMNTSVSETRVVNQRWNQNLWVSLGVFNLTAGSSSVTLTNATYQDYNDGAIDVAFDAVAFVPTTAQLGYVAFGDLYSAGEGLQPYFPNTDISANGAIPTYACHRSKTQAYPELAATTLGYSDVHFQACSGAVVANISPLDGVRRLRL
jgi:hypothetical protein